MITDPVEIAKRTYRAYVENDRDAIEALISADLHFTSPLDNRIDRAAYFERCWPNHQTIIDFEFVRIFANGDEVVATYEGRNTSGGVFRNTEILKIRGGQVVDVEVYFGWNVPHRAEPGGFVHD